MLRVRGVRIGLSNLNEKVGGLLTHPLTITQITTTGVASSSYSEGGQDLRHSLRVVADHGVESIAWCRVVPASCDYEGVVHLHSTCSPAVVS